MSQCHAPYGALRGDVVLTKGTDEDDLVNENRSVNGQLFFVPQWRAAQMHQSNPAVQQE